MHLNTLVKLADMCSNTKATVIQLYTLDSYFNNVVLLKKVQS